jgi:tetratricopeptide (TPR) repeat protein
VRAELTGVATLARAARSPLTDRLVGLASEYAQFMAWLCNDAGNKAAALAWYDRSHDWAVEAGDPNMAATTLSMKSHLAWSVGDPVRTVRLGEAARWHDGHTSAGVQGMAAQMTARGYAIDSDPDAAQRSLDEAETLIRQAAEKPEDEPAWMYFYDETWFTLQRGMVETQIGNGPQAVDLLTRALVDLPMSYRRDRAWYASCLARAHLVAGDLDAATAIAIEAAPDALTLNRYAADELHDVASEITSRSEHHGHAIADAIRTDSS